MGPEAASAPLDELRELVAADEAALAADDPSFEMLLRAPLADWVMEPRIEPRFELLAPPLARIDEANERYE